MFENEAPRWLPGQEPPELQKLLTIFFSDIDRAFPDRLIVWAHWDHANWDRKAGALCKVLGYSRGAAFLTAYGYSIDTGDQILPARPQPPAEAEPAPELPTEAEPAPQPPTETEPAPELSTEAEPAPELPSADCEDWLTGTVANILSNRNSGFIRGDDGGEYYFNIRDFTHRVKLSLGMRVRFQAEERMDHKRQRLRKNAVELTVIP